jgi:hypothetical protein
MSQHAMVTSMLVLKKWLHMWYLGTIVQIDDTTKNAVVHLQGETPERSTSIALDALIPQECLGSPPAMGCFALVNCF